MSALLTPPPAVTVPPPHPAVSPPPPTRPPAEPDGEYEEVNGRRVEKTLSLYERTVSNELKDRLVAHAAVNRLGRVRSETKFAIPGSRNRRVPDVAFVSFAAWAADRPIPRSNAWAVTPELAVEVVSPTDRLFDVVDKVQEYFAGGVRAVWLVLTNVQQVYCYDGPAAVRVLLAADTLTGEAVLPGLAVPVADLFPPAEPLPAEGEA